MPRQAKLLNVKKHLEHIKTSIEYMLHENYRFGENGLKMPPAYVDDLKGINFITSCILRKHEAKKTRKDITL